ncbi:sugar phosphate isomerase/epimerase [Paenibacillus turpanensis]|uniref:sugar phosphate isomerase/epimerase n=1 Tax=Paenibacillus turpanensis TaxID=2689078 RepID=UPI00140D2E25|nr:sugar phosphate isomerase/epimerase [Paenibacillus turpanensis]
MKYVRLKTNLEERCIEDRLQYNPEIIEFFLSEHDLNDRQRLVDAIRYVKSKHAKVYLHHPPKYKGNRLDIMADSSELRQFYWDSSRWLAEICQQEQIRCVIHAHYAQTESSYSINESQSIEMRKRISEILSFSGNVFLWEDTIEGLFSYANPYLMTQIIKPLSLPLIVDVSHCFIALKANNSRLIQILKETSSHAQYYHVVDSMGERHDSLPLGVGKIDWLQVAPLIADRDFIFEISLPGDHSDCTLMIESVKYFNQVLNLAYADK